MKQSTLRKRNLLRRHNLTRLGTNKERELANELAVLGYLVTGDGKAVKIPKKPAVDNYGDVAGTDYSPWELALFANIRRNRKKRDIFACIVTHVSQSGMSRNIKVYYKYKGDLVNITQLVAKVSGLSLAKYGEGVKVGGCGMDMCFNTVYNFCGRLGIDGNDAIAQYYRSL